MEMWVSGSEGVFILEVLFSAVAHSLLIMTKRDKDKRFINRLEVL